VSPSLYLLPLPPLTLVLPSALRSWPPKSNIHNLGAIGTLCDSIRWKSTILRRMGTAIQLLLGAACVAAFAFFLLQQRRPINFLEPLHVGRRRVSGAKTPPQSLSPCRKPQDSQEPDYSTTFPPSRRFTLLEMDLATNSNEIPKGFIATRPDWTKNVVPLKASYLSVDPSMFMPCQFSIKEIQSLGNFPDYATLSGVPLPKPYLDFDIRTALPRPYRPFRWTYHQTMCK